MRIWTFRLQQLISWTLGAAKSKIICQQQSVTFTSNRHGLKEWKSYQLWISWRELRAWQPFVLTLPSWQKEQVMLYDFALSLANRSFFFCLIPIHQSHSVSRKKNWSLYLVIPAVEQFKERNTPFARCALLGSEKSRARKPRNCGERETKQVHHCRRQRRTKF